MNLTLKHVVACYFIIFLMAMIFAGAGQILIITMDMSAVSEEAHRGLVAFSTKMADIVEVSVGALIGALSASMQRVFDSKEKKQEAEESTE